MSFWDKISVLLGGIKFWGSFLSYIYYEDETIDRTIEGLNTSCTTGLI
jgi:hypothetical protein